MRGKHSKAAINIARERITPARAGKTRAGRTARQLGGDHPRACGENREKEADYTGWEGSPPRVRGKPRREFAQKMQERITPARAGKTAQKSCLRRSRRDHPRACGENRWMTGDATDDEGSPPRVRGKPGERAHGTGSLRITPARAGKTNSGTPGAAVFKDHPRACGENLSGGGRRSAPFGSPPRVRGKHPLQLLNCPVFRITPARAGKTASSSTARR